MAILDSILAMSETKKYSRFVEILHADVYNILIDDVIVSEGLMLLLQDVGKAYLALSQYECPKALQLFSNLPSHHYHTGWVLCQVGRAHFEMAQYSQVRYDNISNCF